MQKAVFFPKSTQLQVIIPPSKILLYSDTIFLQNALAVKKHYAKNIFFIEDWTRDN